MLRLAAMCVVLAGCASSDELRTLQARFQLGVGLAPVLAAAQAHCARVETRTYTPQEAAPYASQVQVDCHGYELAGRPRKIELLVNEGELGFYWILIDEEELAAMRTRLERSAGVPECDTPDYAIFAGRSVALRRQPAEILIGLPHDVQAITGGCG